MPYPALVKFPSDREAKRRLLLDAVRDVSAVVTAHALESEALETLAPESVEALDVAGLFRLKLPAELGGAEADPVTQMEVIEALAHVDANAAWVMMIGASSIAFPGAFLPDEGIAEVFAGGSVPRCAGAGAPSGVAVPVAGGYRLSGTWAFASGCRHSQWLQGGAVIDNQGEGGPEARMFVFPAAAARIHDNWQVAGLQGTGSCDISVEGLFLPSWLSWDFEDMIRGRPRRGGPIFRLGQPGFTTNEHAAFSIGVARRALDLVIDAARSKRRGRGAAAVTLADRAVFQRFAGQADLRLRAARSLAMASHERAMTLVEDGASLDPATQAELRAANVYATETGVAVTEQAFRYAGGSALHLEDPLQRCLRDVNAGAQHLAASDIAYENHGQFLLGLSQASPRY